MNSSAVPSVPLSGGLADLSGAIFKIALYLDKEPADLEAATLAARFDDAIKEFEAAGTRANVPLANIRLAKYALTAFIDQKVLTSNLALKDAWLEKPLQMTYFDDFISG